MGRSDFDRIPFAQQSPDLIPSIPDVPQEYRSRIEDGKIVPGSSVSCGDDNSPDIEVGKYLRFKEDSRKRGTAVSFVHGELQVFAFFNRVTSAMLQKHLSDAISEGKAVKSMSLLLDVDSSREMIHDLTRWGFRRDASRDTPLFWVFVNSLTKKPKSRVVDVKPEPKIESKPLMTVSEYQSKTAELDALRSRIKHLGDGGAT